MAKQVAPGFGPRRVLLLELNEITWTLMDPMIAAGKLPNLGRLREQGTWSSPRSVDEPPHLDPWITWVTVHTGVSREVHGATILEQDSQTITARRTWDYAVDAGKTVGVFGSIGAYPPRPVPGFIVPGPFAPGPETYPEYLAPVQRLNRVGTQIHNKLAGEMGLWEMAKDGIALMREFGLSASTAIRIAAQLAEERVRKHIKWKRVCLQPLANFDLFASLYHRYRPEFATWHTNHVAHYMHHYWKAHDDSGFPTPVTAEDRERFGGAIEYGYRIADELVGKFVDLVDDDTIIVVASSMGQQPYVSDTYVDGRVLVAFKDIRQVLDIVGADATAEVNAIMAPQWNITIRDPARRKHTFEALERAQREVDGVRQEALSLTETGDTITINPKGLTRRVDGVRYYFPGAPGDRAGGFAFDDLFAIHAETNKQGMHHPVGSLVIWGKGIAAGRHVADTTNLDLAPTLLTLLGVEVPAIMPGRVLAEAWSD